ncbi:hypothetical protein, partial [Paenibacillus sp. 2003]|uniref:hypothetical protein n=1 Tax=Paenibacillus sp. 2003 TaxID=2817761 RepID=UPI00286C8BC6
EKSDKLILNLTRLKISFVLQSIQAKACLELLRSFCKQNVHSLVVQFSKIKHDLFHFFFVSTKFRRRLK